jgi:hypothetical protein
MFGERTLPNNDGNKILIPSRLRQLLLRSCSLAFSTFVSRNFADLLYLPPIFNKKRPFFTHAFSLECDFLNPLLLRKTDFLYPGQLAPAFMCVHRISVTQ